jgi:drug/metabolite transporter (DMT)-like permease
MKLCGKRTSGEFNSVCINLARSVICLLVSVIIWQACGGGSTNSLGHFLIIVAGICNALNLFTWILSSALVPLMLIESISMLGSLVLPLILAPYLYNGDTIKPIQWVGCALIFASIFFFMNKDEGEKKQAGKLKKIVLVSTCIISGTVALLAGYLLLTGRREETE